MGIKFMITIAEAERGDKWKYTNKDLSYSTTSGPRISETNKFQMNTENPKAIFIKTKLTPGSCLGCKK